MFTFENQIPSVKVENSPSSQQWINLTLEKKNALYKLNWIIGMQYR